MQEGLIMREEKRKKKRKKKKKKKKKKRKEIWQCFVMEENKGLRQCVEKRMKLMRWVHGRWVWGEESELTRAWKSLMNEERE